MDGAELCMSLGASDGESLGPALGEAVGVAVDSELGAEDGAAVVGCEGDDDAALCAHMYSALSGGCACMRLAQPAPWKLRRSPRT